MKIPVSESLFNKVVGIQTCNFIKERLQHRCFTANIVKFLRTALFIRTPLVSASEKGQVTLTLQCLVNFIVNFEHN